jgi:hypothetical protein
MDTVIGLRLCAHIARRTRGGTADLRVWVHPLLDLAVQRIHSDIDNRWVFGRA